MEDVTRKRVLRMLERLPDDQLYQVLDYIEFLETKYARESARKPDAFQEFAERVEDQLRVRSLAPRAMKGTMRIMSTAGRMIDGVRELGKGLAEPPPSRPTRRTGGGPTGPEEDVPDDASGPRGDVPEGGRASGASGGNGR